MLNIVAYSRKSCTSVAKYYAKLTCRKAIKVNSICELLAIDEIDVYVTDVFEQDYLEKLSDPTCITSRSSAIGIIYAPHYPSTEELLKKIAIQSQQVSQDIKKRVAIYPFKSLGIIEQVEGDFILGNDAPNESILNAIRSNKGLFSLFTHGGGYDAFVTPSLTLCAMADSAKSLGDDRREGEGPPLCKSVQFCWRHNKPFNAIELNETLISATQIQTDLMLLHACFNVSPDGGKLSKEFSLVEKILLYGKAKTLITFYGLNISNESFCELLGDSIVQAPSIGEGLKNYLLMTRDIKKLERPLLFGDPKTQLNCRSYTIEDGKIPPEILHALKSQSLQYLPGEKGNISSLIEVSKQQELTFQNISKFDYKAHWSSYCERRETAQRCMSCDCKLNYFDSTSTFEYEPRVLVECCGCGIVTQDKPTNNPIRIERTGNNTFEIRPTVTDGEKWVIIELSTGNQQFIYKQYFENGQSITNALCVAKRHLNFKFDMKVKVLHRHKSALDFVYLAIKN